MLRYTDQLTLHGQTDGDLDQRVLDRFGVVAVVELAVVVSTANATVRLSNALKTPLEPPDVIERLRTRNGGGSVAV